MSETEQRIRERAYQLWEQAGRPHERSEEFWFAAQREIEGGQPPIGDRPSGPPEQASPGSEEDAQAAPVDEVAATASAGRKVRAARAVASPAARKAATLEETGGEVNAGKPSPRPKRR